MRLRTLGLLLGYLFMYLPLVSVMVYSFNASRLVTVWGGFSTHWYGVLLDNDALQDALARSLEIAALSATGATVLGTCAALALSRNATGPWQWLMTAALAALLVVPEVILGFAELLTFVTLEQWLGWPAGRGTITIVCTHITLAMAYVTVLVRGRLATLDRSVEDAAADLGAAPHRVLLQVTLPLLAPALLAAWLLAFTLSLDDVVLASFTSGPASTTLPMVVYSSVRFGVSPQINALATLLIGTVAIGIAIATWLLLRGARWRGAATGPSAAAASAGG